MTAPAPTVAALRNNHARVAGMLADRDLSGDLLLVALTFAHIVDFYPYDEWKIARFADWLFPTPAYAHGPRHRVAAVTRIAKVLKKDIRRYVAPPSDGRCDAAVRGRDGVCGRPGTAVGATITDLATGELAHMTACARHADWLRGLHATNQQDCAATPPPAPAANTGGVLCKHLGELDWPTFWRKIDPDWIEPAETDATPMLRRQVPLRLVAGDATGGPGRIPQLSVIRNA